MSTQQLFIDMSHAEAAYRSSLTTVMLITAHHHTFYLRETREKIALKWAWLRA